MRWTNVKDKLPEPRSHVLAFTDDYCYYTAYYDGYWYLTGEPEAYEVTYWMPLPEPPRTAQIEAAGTASKSLDYEMD